MYCTGKRIKILLLITWTGGIILIVSISLAHHFFDYDWETPAYHYFYPSLDFSIIIATLVTYSFLFSKYKQSWRKNNNTNETGEIRVSAFTLFRRSKFYIPALLVGTFIVFMVVPGELIKILFQILWPKFKRCLSNQVYKLYRTLYVFTVKCGNMISE